MCRLCSFEECLKFSWKETCSLSEQFSANSAPNQGLLIIRSLNLYTKMWVSGVFFTPNLCAHVLLVVQTVDNLPAMQGSQVWSLGWEDPLEEGMATHSSILPWRIQMDRGAWWTTAHGVSKSRTYLSNYHFHFTFKLMFTYLSSVGNPMDRGPWQAAVHVVTRVGHSLATKPPPKSRHQF